MLFRLLGASLVRRFRQLALIATAIAVAAATVATLATFSRRVEASLDRDLRAFGPNITVRSQVGAPHAMAAEEVARIRELVGVENVTQASGSQLGVRADPMQVRAVAAAIEAAIPGVEARPLLRVTESDRAVAQRVSRVLAVIAILAFVSALVAVGSATTALVGERRSEIALLFALGCTTERAAGLFAAELFSVAALSALVGEGVGLVAAQGLSSRILGAGAVVHGSQNLAQLGVGFAAAVAVAVATVGLALAVSLGRIAAVDPARVLKGE